MKSSAAIGIGLGLVMFGAGCRSSEQTSAWTGESGEPVPEYTGPKPGMRAFVEDLNFDGRMDVVLAGPEEMFGNGGGPFDVFLGTAKGTHTFVGRIGGQPWCFNLQRERTGVGLLSIYSRSSAHTGMLFQYEITGSNISGSHAPREMRFSEELPNPDALLFESLFSSNAPGKLPLREPVQIDGTWTWRLAENVAGSRSE